ncbi:hypothetical protein LguiA_021352 [Lonicera macranthoides]
MVNGAAKQCSNAIKYVKKSLQKVAKRLDLVYGGGSIGLMGLVSQVVYIGGGHVIGGKKEYIECSFCWNSRSDLERGEGISQSIESFSPVIDRPKGRFGLVSSIQSVENWCGR